MRNASNSTLSWISSLDILCERPKIIPYLFLPVGQKLQFDIIQMMYKYLLVRSLSATKVSIRQAIAS
jgi:hypothetical protein